MAGWCPGGQAEMSENPSDHKGIFNGGDDLQGVTAMGTVFDIDIEYPFEQAGRNRLMGLATRIIRSII